MLPNQENKDKNPDANKLPLAETGNASNPSPPKEESNGESQLLNKKAEKYLREVANIEDLPDAQDQQNMDETLKEENEK
jgi:hypothetical protein